MSCQANSVYLSAEHPALSGLIRTTPSIVVDGYFEQIPNNSVVLLRRTKNGMPCAFFYQLGAGYVFVTSMYEDWASTNWQSTAEGRAFVRDLITWAKKPVSLPTYNISENPHPTVSLNVEIKNSTEKQTGKVKILWLNPDKNLDINLNLTENICINILNYSGENAFRKGRGNELENNDKFNIDRINSKIGGRNEI